ncbi:hypothetical protein A3I51_02830 [Candidatus Gottesmanbacteria bacterium RIFCSPLOWO2_02_FULL_38_8]|uniref:Uncharacterized protein n=1 Tax=Candidatus Gottesmanbacteria bacterium RIFCSPLOWO2_02_FULL_38_8 TaxID=1798397 RepID=A0A1F6B2D6_9BACT|nr:MAG: hypothetical protein A3I51_02830 [Candidatus Gottesmanbacteria bacterium RIFCSPLOWO2_02_FULL_38_8]
MSKNNKFLLLLLITLFLSVPASLFAQPPNFSIATTFQIPDKDLEDGDIISLDREKNQMVRSRIPYDEQTYGVYVKYPKIVYHNSNSVFPIAKTGEISVNVTTINGPIKVGDYVSSSEIPGKGQKASEFTGYMLGVALASFGEKDGIELVYKDKKLRSGQVIVAVGIGPASPALIKAAGGFFGTFRSISSSFLSNIATSRQAEKIFRYFLAASVAIISILVSLFFFGKNVTKGIEMIGRNPLAKVPIQSMILVNVLIIAVIALGGIILSLIILSL